MFKQHKVTLAVKYALDYATLMNMTISINQLSVTTIIGIYPAEREKAQELLFDIEVRFDGQAASESDDIYHTIDYFKLSEDVATFVESTSYQLLERLVTDIADLVLAHPQAQWCSIRATKPEVQSRAKDITLYMEKGEDAK